MWRDVGKSPGAGNRSKHPVYDRNNDPPTSETNWVKRGLMSDLHVRPLIHV